MGGLAVALFIGLFVFGEQVFGLPMDHGRVQVALLVTFVLGIIVGWKSSD